MAKTARKPGRPTAYTPKIDREICTRIARNEALVEICSDDHLPSDTAVAGWLAKAELGDKRYVDFLGRFLRARQASAERVDAAIRDVQRRMMVPRMIDNPAYEPLKAAQGNGYSVPPTIANPEYVDAQVGREVISAHKWRAAHLNAPRYGNRVEVSGTVKHEHAHRIDPPDWMQDAIERVGDDPPMIEVEAEEVETKH